MARAGLVLQSAIPAICTMQWSTYFVEAPSRRLPDLCSVCGITQVGAHTARGDALATAGLLQHYIHFSRRGVPWEQIFKDAETYEWPQCARRASPNLLPREATRERRPDEWLDNLLSRMPRSDEPLIDSYLATLDTVLADGFLAENEKLQLIEVASEAGIDRTTADDLHRRYLKTLVKLAWEDGVITKDEHKKLQNISSMLGISSQELTSFLAQKEQTNIPDIPIPAGQSLRLEMGDRLCFTGEMQRPRAEWEKICLDRGYKPGGLLKSTKLLIAADPNSQSRKADLARKRGIPIITEEAFAELLKQ